MKKELPASLTKMRDALSKHGSPALVKLLAIFDGLSPEDQRWAMELMRRVEEELKREGRI